MADATVRNTKYMAERGEFDTFGWVAYLMYRGDVLTHREWSIIVLLEDRDLWKMPKLTPATSST